MEKNYKKKIKQYVFMLIPAALLALGGVFFRFLVKLGGASGILSSFASLTFWLAGLVLLLDVAFGIGELLDHLAVLLDTRRASEKKQTKWTLLCERIRTFFERFKRKKPALPDIDAEVAEEEKSAFADGMSEIPTELKHIRSASNNVIKTKRRNNIFDTLHACFSVAFVASLLLWLYFFCTKMLAAAVPPATDTYSFGLLNTLYFIFFSVLLSIWNKMRAKPEKQDVYKISGDLLTVVSAASLIYAGVIAVQSVLAVNAHAALPWVLRAVVVYITVAVAVNAVIAIMKGNVLGEVDYSLLPTKSASGNGVLDSDDIKARFSLKSLWSIKFALQLLPGIALSIGLVLWVSTMFFVVQPGEKAVLYRFGTIEEESVLDSGLHVKFPWPIDKVDTYNVDSVTSIRIGYENPTDNNYLWTMSHGGEEYPLLTGNGKEVVAVNMKLAYRINDLYSYVSTATDPESVISAAAYESIMRRTINTTLDMFLSVDRASLSADLKAELQSFSDERALGIEVVDIIIENIHPPVDVADVYQAVITASVDKQTLITEAEAGALEYLNYAAYYKEQLINDAKKKQAEAISAATGEMAYYYAALEAYKVNPDCFKLTRFINVQEKRIAGTKVYYFSPNTEEYIGSFIIGGKGDNVIVTDDE